jgi:hypothetical protein
LFHHSTSDNHSLSFGDHSSSDGDNTITYTPIPPLSSTDVPSIPPSLPPVTVPTAPTEAPVTAVPTEESSLTTAPTSQANGPVIITDDPVIADDDWSSSAGGTPLETPIPVQVVPTTGDPIVDTVIAASESAEQVVAKNGTSPGQTAMIVVLAIAAAAVGAAFVSHKIYSGRIKGASAGSSNVSSENSWNPAGDGAVGSSSAPRARMQGSASRISV